MTMASGHDYAEATTHYFRHYAGGLLQAEPQGIRAEAQADGRQLAVPEPRLDWAM